MITGDDYDMLEDEYERLRKLEAKGVKLGNPAMLLDPATLDEAIVGVLAGRAVYDRDKLVELFEVDSFGGSDEERRQHADEHVCFNVERSLPYYADLGGPILVEPWDEDMAELIGDELGLWKIELAGRSWITSDPDIVKLARAQ